MRSLIVEVIVMTANCDDKWQYVYEEDDVIHCIETPTKTSLHELPAAPIDKHLFMPQWDERWCLYDSGDNDASDVWVKKPRYMVSTCVSSACSSRFTPCNTVGLSDRPRSGGECCLRGQVHADGLALAGKCGHMGGS